MRTMRRRDDRGATAVEFALVSIPFLFLVIGMIQYGWYFYVAQSAGGTASNVARRLQVGDCWSGNEARDLAKSQSPMVTQVVKTPTSVPASSGGSLTVEVHADGRIIGLIPLPDGGVVIKTVQATVEDINPDRPCP
jgi:hypothetical protein